MPGVWRGDDAALQRRARAGRRSLHGLRHDDRLSARPRRTLSRRDLVVTGRRAPKGPEALALLKGVEVLELRSAAGPVQIALDPSALTGFLAWLEARPPGATLPG